MATPAPAGVPHYFRGQRDPDWPLASSLERRILALRGGDQPGASQVYPYDCRFLRNGEPMLDDGGFDAVVCAHLERFKRAASGLRGPIPKDRLSGAPELVSSDFPDRLTILRTPIDELGRLQQQRGLFTLIRSNRYFELQGLLDDTGRGDLLTQVVVGASVIPHALRDLELHGIDHRMLLPDMYGAATHANALLEFDSARERGVSTTFSSEGWERRLQSRAERA